MQIGGYRRELRIFRLPHVIADDYGGGVETTHHQKPGYGDDNQIIPVLPTDRLYFFHGCCNGRHRSILLLTISSKDNVLLH
jgi:hypothetical protein